MTKASDAMDFEAAAQLRDRLRAMSHIQSTRASIRPPSTKPICSPLHSEGGQTCIQVFFFRAGQNWGNRPYFPRHPRDMPLAKCWKLCRPVL